MHDRYENTEARIKRVEEEGLMYIGMGVSGGEEGARHGVLRPLHASHFSSCFQATYTVFAYPPPKGLAGFANKTLQAKHVGCHCLLSTSRLTLRVVADYTAIAAGPSLMPGGTRDAYKHIEPIVKAVAAQVQPLPFLPLACMQPVQNRRPSQLPCALVPASGMTSCGPSLLMWQDVRLQRPVKHG